MSKKIAILGAGESGVGTAVLALKKGYTVFLSDKGKIADKYKAVLLQYNIPFEEEKHTESEILSANLVVKSPGIPDKAELIVKLKTLRIPVISEIEFAGKYTNAKIIGITGSNGKTTTTSLIYHLLKENGLNVGLGGNIGKSFAMQVAENSFDSYVLELSSFQLDGMYDFKTDISVLLNITPDHLDRYNYEFQNYIDSKFRIIQNNDAKTVFVYGLDDENIVKNFKVSDYNGKKLPFSIKTKTDGAFWENDVLVAGDLSLRTSELPIKGKHNVANALAAILVAKEMGISNDGIKSAIKTFTAIEHRLEFVKTVNGVTYINDSKATNVDSTWYALDAMDNNVIWIVGGVDKGNDYSVLMDLVKQKVKGVICLGVDNQKLLNEFGAKVPQITEAKSAKEAVEKAKEMAKEGYQVLLSPACASFDLFKNYEDRGQQFKQAIHQL